MLDYPIARGFDEDTLVPVTTAPNGLSPAAPSMEYDQAAVQVWLGLGNNVGSNFNITLLSIIQGQWIGEFYPDDIMRLTYQYLIPRT